MQLDCRESSCLVILRAAQLSVLCNSCEQALIIYCADCASCCLICGSFRASTGRRLARLLLAFRGFNPRAAEFWKWVCADSKSTCGIALRTAQSVVAPDVAACDFMADSEDQKVYLETGIRACQTTPLILPGGRNVVGMISTH